MCGAWEEGLSGSLLLFSPDNAIECVLHACDVLNKRGFARPYVLSEQTLVMIAEKKEISGTNTSGIDITAGASTPPTDTYPADCLEKQIGD